MGPVHKCTASSDGQNGDNNALKPKQFSGHLPRRSSTFSKKDKITKEIRLKLTKSQHLRPRERFPRSPYSETEKLLGGTVKNVDEGN